MMNKIIFVVSTLAIFALPGAFGFMCYSCNATEPYNTPSLQCMEGSAYMNESCSNGTTYCAVIKVTVNGVMVYIVGCVTVNKTCSEYNATVCSEIISKGNGTIMSCSTNCCNEERCNMPIFPTTGPTTIATSGGPNDTTPTSGVEFFAPKVIALLAAYLSALYFGKQ
ncbi:uncharacterized protein [Pocillopora verrucosa]|uniref:uncharacterized protein n=1 Tax=Pocillopora verrucosa TaxID=203993 RepID=UPI00333E9131